MNNISKYIAISDFCLVEYEMNRDNVTLNLSTLGAKIATTKLGTKQYFNTNKPNSLGITNNVLEFNAEPSNSLRTSWWINPLDITQYVNLFDSSTNVSSVGQYNHDTIKLHFVSGYNFDDIAGFLCQIRAMSESGNLVDLSNFTYIKQADALSSAAVVQFSSNVLHLGNKFYDKYILFKIPSVQALSSDRSTLLGNSLLINALSDIYIIYSEIDSVINNTFIANEYSNVQIPVSSVADNFNCIIYESTYGDFIEYYATWADDVIGQHMADIESGRIKLYTSNNPNDNYQEFADIYGEASAKWVLMHEIYVYESMIGNGGGASLLTQKFVFTQEDNFASSNMFRPVLRNADLDTSYIIQYVCRLLNRMDGTQIIRKASFASMDPKKYGLKFTRLNVDNIIPYNVYNKIESEKSANLVNNKVTQTKYTKLYFDTTTVVLNYNNEVFPQGTGPLFLKSNDSIYKFKFEKFSTSNSKINVDLSGAYNYALTFKLDDNSKIELSPTYSTNMNTVIGELEFKIMSSQIDKLMLQKNNNYSIIIKNADGTQYTFYEGVYFSYGNYNAVIANYDKLTTVSDLNAQILELQATNKALTDENSSLKVK
jgi:hypothetical protein